MEQGLTGVTGPSGSIGYVGEIFQGMAGYSSEVRIPAKKGCPLCCGKGKVEKQGLFGIIKLVKCRCKR